MDTLGRRIDGRRACYGARIAGLLAAGLVALAGCSGVKEQLGMTKKSPDEFAVTAKAPLVQPPNYALRPPQPGAARPQEYLPREQAQAALTQKGGDTAPGQARPWLRETADPRKGDLSAGEAKLLGLARADNADPAIRRRINEEYTQLVEREKSFVDKLIFWQKPAPPGTVVDANRESQRLREASTQGLPPTAGDTPSIERRKRAILEGIF
jgi:hypothetical protein